MLPLHRIVWSAAEWVEAIASAAADGVLPTRVVLAPSHEAGMAIRATLSRAPRPDLLAGLHIITPFVAALQTLAHAGIACVPGEDALRAARVAWVAERGVSLHSFDVALLQSGRGWEDAVATALADLDDANVTRQDMRATGDARLADLATLWDACESAAGTSWTRARVLREAATALASDPSAWPFSGPALVVAAGDESAAAAQFVRAIPHACLVAVPARPLHPRSLACWTALWGTEVTVAVGESAARLATPLMPPRTERDRLVTWLFAPPAVVLGERSASPGDDGTLALECHPGVEEETAAAIAWVAREVRDHGTPIARLALLVPSLDPLAALLVQRLNELPWPDEMPAAYVAGGLPLTARPVGARLAAAVHALHAGSDATADAPLAAMRDATLAAIWQTLTQWWTDTAGDGIDARMAMKATAAVAEAFVADTALSAQRGPAATRLLVHAVDSARWPSGEFGGGLYIGTLESAISLDFDAVRVLGLAEGSVPSTPREHPLLSDAMRTSLSAALPLSVDASFLRLQAMERSVRAARYRIALSASLTGTDRGRRSPSAVFVDAGTAVRRALPDGRIERVADSRALELAWFAPARAAASASAPPTNRARAREAAMTHILPADWTSAGAWNVERAYTLARDGEALIAPRDISATSVPGLTATRAISASAAQNLLGCPRAFYFSRVLGWKELEDAHSLYGLSAMEYGALLHEVLQHFSDAHGPAFGERHDTLDAWTARALVLSDEAMHAYLERRPLRGASVRTALAGRLHTDVRLLMRYDWNGGTPRRYVGAEIEFGVPVPLQLGADGLFVRGRIDRLDVEADTTFLRDFKSGRARPRADNAFDALYDLQLGVYLLVLQRMASTWRVPAHAIAAFAYPGHGADQERAFRADAEALTRATAEWLHVCAALLGAREFPQTPEKATCERCAYRRVCGDDAPRRAAAALACTTAAPSRAFARLWSKDTTDEEDGE